MRVTGDMREDGHSRQGHQDGSDKVTSYPAWNHCHQHPSAVQHGAQVESHTGEKKNSELWFI